MGITLYAIIIKDALVANRILNNKLCIIWGQKTVKDTIAVL